MVSVVQEDASSSQSVKLLYLSQGVRVFLAPFLCYHMAMNGAYDKALSLLAMREHTEKEMRDKLSKRGFSSEDIEDALDTLKSNDELSERRTAEVYVHSRLKKKAEGKNILVMRLVEKGTPRSIAEEVVKEYWENEDYLPIIRKEYKLLEAKYGKDKAIDKLRMRGFSKEEIRRSKDECDD